MAWENNDIELVRIKLIFNGSVYTYQLQRINSKKTFEIFLLLDNKDVKVKYSEFIYTLFDSQVIELIKIA